MTTEEFLYFDRMPQILPLYAALREKLVHAYPNLDFHVTKTQISFRNRHVFAMASLPFRRLKGWPAVYLLVSLGLSYRKESPRIAQAAEPYPNRWTHHIPIVSEDELDAELMEWLNEAYQFSMVK